MMIEARVRVREIFEGKTLLVLKIEDRGRRQVIQVFSIS